MQLIGSNRLSVVYRVLSFSVEVPSALWDMMAAVKFIGRGYYAQATSVHHCRQNSHSRLEDSQNAGQSFSPHGLEKANGQEWFHPKEEASGSLSGDMDADRSGKDDTETADLSTALLLSKAESPPLSCDGVVLLRLTRMARSPDVKAIFLEHPALADCRSRVTNAGCEITPSWAGGARLLVPFTAQQLQEFEQEGFELLDHHILALNSDQESIEGALRDLPRKCRPRLFNENRINQARPNLGAQSPLDSQAVTSPQSDVQEPEEDDDTPMVVVERTFSATNSSLGYPVWEEPISH